MTEFSGTLEGVGLPAIVRFLAGLEKTGCLRITHQDWGGEIHFESGQITSATLGSRKGLSALDALVQALPGAAFVFDGDARWTDEPNITLSRDEMQTHLTELVEQSAHGGPTLPSLDVVPVLVPQDDESAAEETMPLDRGTVQTLLAIDGTRSVRDIISARGSFEALWQIANLAQLGLVRLPNAEPTPAQSGPVETTQPGRGGTAKAAPGKAAAAATVTPSTATVTQIGPVAPVAPAASPSRVSPVPPAAAVAAATTATVTSAEAPHCPKLGFEDDPANSFGRPTRLHRCFAAGTPLPLSLDQQRELCLSDQFGTCPRLAMAGLAPAPAVAAAAPLEAAAPSSTPQPETPIDDPRIVRLPVGGRGGSAARVAASAEAAGAVASEPARLRPTGQVTREPSVTQPTPLRGRPSRVGAAATVAAVSDAPSGANGSVPPPPTAARPSLAPTEPAPRRRSPFNLPVPTTTLAAAAMVVMVIAVVAVLLTPHLGELFTDETTVDMSALPNANAALEGTPVAELGGARTTAVPAAAAPAGSTAPNASGATAPNASGASATNAPGNTAPNASSAPNAPGASAPNASGATAPNASGSTAPNTSGAASAAPAAAVVATAPQAAGNTAPDAAATTPAAQPAAEPGPAAAAAPALAASRTLLEESFDGNERNWLNNPQGVAWITGGSYRVMPRQAGQFVAVAVPAVGEILQDVIVNASFRKVGGPAGGGYGIIVRDQGPAPRDGSNQLGRYYVLEVGDKGEVGIWRREGDRWIDLLPWTRSDAVKPGNASNEVTVKAIGDTLSLSVNGTEVGTRTDDALAVGNVGVFVGGDGNSVTLDQISVRTP